jgi:hypothetical protein
MKQNSCLLILSFGLIFVAQVQCLTLEEVQILVKDEVQILVKHQVEVLVKDQVDLKAENRFLRDQILSLNSQMTSLSSAKDVCPCDLTYIEDWLKENSIDLTNLRVAAVLLQNVVDDLTDLTDDITDDLTNLTDLTDDITDDLTNITKSPIGTITAWVPKVQQNQPSVIELPSGN